jgi:hypothetical protein
MRQNKHARRSLLNGWAIGRWVLWTAVTWSPYWFVQERLTGWGFWDLRSWALFGAVIWVLLIDFLRRETADHYRWRSGK